MYFFRCYQIRDHLLIEHDVKGKPVQVRVNRRFGCELRCTSKYCGRKNGKNGKPPGLRGWKVASSLEIIIETDTK